MALQNKMKEFSSLKALQIVIALTDKKGYVTISELSEITGLSPSTTHRILQELSECGFVIKEPSSKRYGTGIEVMQMAMKVKMSDYLLEAARDEMTRLNDLSQETIHLIFPDNDQAIYIGKVEAKHQIQLRSRIGWRIPLQCTSGGKLILAYHTREWVENYLKYNPLKHFTDHTILQEGELFRELETIRNQGFSLDNREHNPDIVCVAAPIFAADEKLAGTIGISAPDYRFSPEKALSLADEVKRSGAAVSKKLQS